jgi:hypothetical protein
MVRAWYMDDSDADQRLPHVRPGGDADVSMALLDSIGVLQFSMNPNV